MLHKRGEHVLFRLTFGLLSLLDLVTSDLIVVNIPPRGQCFELLDVIHNIPP